jgi:N-methylhydantoinase A
MRSDGGVTAAELAKQKPVSVVESGPAAGVIAASFYGKTLRLRNIMSFDMGGTTAKAGLIKDCTPNLVTEYEVGGKVHSGRIIKGSGYPIRFPFIDLSECSAGGGTIAWVDAGGALKVGPISAGAIPGPACYDMGGQDPTITDANLVLGRLNPNYILGGTMKVNGQLSIETIEEKICNQTELNVLQAAVGIVGIVNSTMAKILRIVSVERGHDPRDFTLIAFGGAGPMHACALAEDLGISKIVIPPSPGFFSALGMLTADFKYHSTHPILKSFDEVDPTSIEEMYKEMEDKDRRIMEKGNTTFLDTFCVRQVDMRYQGQAFELIVPTSRPFDEARLKQLILAFHDKHRSVYGYAIDGSAVELVNLRLETIGVTSKPNLRKALLGKPDASEALKTIRSVFFEDSKIYTECPIYDRQRLTPGNVVEGPVIIEQYDATTVIYPRWNGFVGEYGELTVTMDDR